MHLDDAMGGRAPPAAAKEISLFVSSPGDVAAEREAVGRVVERLHTAYRSAVTVRTVRWEQNYYTADRTFQSQIEDPQSCDIVVSIFWSRIGSELPPGFELMPDGQPYPSGTIYELLKALEAKSKRGLPDILVYRKTQDVATPVGDPKLRKLIETQLDAVHSFWTKRFVSDQGHFLAGYHTFNTTDDFEKQFDAHLRKWLTDRGLLTKLVTWPVAQRGSPFRGLEPFDVEHEEVMFGRSAEVERGVALVQKSLSVGCGFVLITGESGTGKSSLARAGLIPRVMRLAGADGSDVWRLARMRPAKSDSLLTLAEALFEALPELRGSDYPTPALLRALLSHGDATTVLPVSRTLARLADEWRAKEGLDRPAQGRVVVLIDQLEELFSSDINDTDREVFAAVCTELANSGSAVLIATLRADAYPIFIGSNAFRSLKAAGQTLDISTPGHAQIAEIVTKSAEAAGLTFDTDPVSEKRLNALLIADTEGRDALPLLQFALQRLYDAMVTRFAAAGRGLASVKPAELVLQFKDYADFGGLEGALRDAAEDAFGGLDEDARSRLPRLARALLRRGESGYTLQSAGPHQFAHDVAALRLIEALTKARILVRGDDASIRFAHEAVQRSWERLAKIIAAHQTFYRVRADVQAAHQRWLEAGGRDAQADDFLIPSGVPIAEAEKAAREYAQDFSKEELDYIGRSGRRARFRHRLLQAAVVAFAALFAVAGIFAVVAQRRGTAALLAQSKILSVIAQHTSAPDRQVNTPDPMFMSGDPTSGASLALEGLPYPGFGGNRPSSPDLEMALYDALLRVRETTLMGHTDSVNAAVFSPDGQHLVTASADRTARLWQQVRSNWKSIVLSGHTGAVNAAAFSPNGRHLVTVSDDHTVRLWHVGASPPTSQLLHGHDAPVIHVAFSPDGRYFVTTSDDGTARLWVASAAHPSSIALRGHADVVNFAVFSPDSRYLLTTSWDHTVRLWDVSVPQPTSVVLDSHTDRIGSAAFSPDGNLIITTSNDGTARLWDLRGANPVSSVLERHLFPVNSVAFSSKGTHLATVSDDHTVHLWNLTATPPTEVVMRGHSDAVNFVVFSPDGHHVATASNDRTIRLWDMNGSQIVMEGHTGPIRCIAFSPDGQHLITGSRDRTARVWDLVGASQTSVLRRGHDGAVNFVAYSPDGLLLASGSDDGTARLWKTKDQTTPPVTLQGHTGSVNSGAFSPDGRWLATASWDRTVRLWDLQRPQAVSVVLRGHTGSVNSVAFNPDGTMLATGSDDHTVRLWSIKNTSTAERVLQGHAGPVSAVAFSPDGRQLATASWDQTVRLWDLTAAQPTWAELRGHSGAVNSVIFSRDGRWLVTTSHDQTARWWDLGVSRPTSVVLGGHTDSVNAAAFSSDGRHLITVSSDHNARMWDFSGDQPASFVLEVHSRPVTSVAFAPDGRHFATSSWDKTVRIWVHYPALSDLIAAVFAHTQRCLTSAQRVSFGLSAADAADDPNRVPGLVIGADGRPQCE
jgi:WD40 repeat protein